MNIPEIIVPQMNGFSIYDSKTGLFSLGGMPPKWGKRGKIWNSIGALKNHLNGALVFREYAHRYNNLTKNQICVRPDYKDAIIVEVSTNKKSSLDIKAYIQTYIDKMMKENAYCCDDDVVWL